jgi:hypothetical protein
MNPQNARLRRSPWRHPQILLTLFSVFAVGAGFGIIGHRLFQGSRPKAPAAGFSEANSAATKERLRRELNLSNEQAVRIEQILEDYSKFYGSLQEQYTELQMQMDDVRSSGNQRIKTVLTEEQRRKFDQLFTPATKAGK